MDEIGLRTSRPPPLNNVYKLCITFLGHNRAYIKKKSGIIPRTSKLIFITQCTIVIRFT